MCGGGHVWIFVVSPTSYHSPRISRIVQVADIRSELVECCGRKKHWSGIWPVQVRVVRVTRRWNVFDPGPFIVVRHVILNPTSSIIAKKNCWQLEVPVQQWSLMDRVRLVDQRSRRRRLVPPRMKITWRHLGCRSPGKVVWGTGGLRMKAGSSN